MREIVPHGRRSPWTGGHCPAWGFNSRHAAGGLRYPFFMASETRIPLFPLADVVHFPRTELRLQELQSELIHVSRLSAMGTMASTLAHELNQPLTAVANYLEETRQTKTQQTRTWTPMATRSKKVSKMAQTQRTIARNANLHPMTMASNNTARNNTP